MQHVGLLDAARFIYEGTKLDCSTGRIMSQVGPQAAIYILIILMGREMEKNPAGHVYIALGLALFKYLYAWSTVTLLW